jgi:hypothetical protein
MYAGHGPFLLAVAFCMKGLDVLSHSNKRELRTQDYSVSILCLSSGLLNTRKHKENPVPGGIAQPPSSWWTQIRVGGVSDETVKCGYGFCVTRTIE